MKSAVTDYRIEVSVQIEYRRKAEVDAGCAQFRCHQPGVPAGKRDERKCMMRDPNHCGRSPTTMTVDYADILELSNDLFARKVCMYDRNVFAREGATELTFPLATF